MTKRKNTFKKVALTSVVCVSVLSSNIYCTDPNCPSKESDLPTEQGDFSPFQSQNPYSPSFLAGDTGVSGVTLK